MNCSTLIMVNVDEIFTLDHKYRFTFNRYVMFICYWMLYKRDEGFIHWMAADCFDMRANTWWEGDAL